MLGWQMSDSKTYISRWRTRRYVSCQEEQSRMKWRIQRRQNVKRHFTEVWTYERWEKLTRMRTTVEDVDGDIVPSETAQISSFYLRSPSSLLTSPEICLGFHLAPWIQISAIRLYPLRRHLDLFLLNSIQSMIGWNTKFTRFYHSPTTYRIVCRCLQHFLSILH
jgi:hypothetical protein